MTEAETSALKKMVNEHVMQLAEHFDSVQVFVTLHDDADKDTCAYESGRGNFYARLGQVAEWKCIQDQYQRDHASRKTGEEDDE